MNIDLLNLQCQIKEYKNRRFIQVETYVNGELAHGFIDVIGFFAETHLMTKQEMESCLGWDDEYEQYNRAIKRFNGITSKVYLDSCSCGAAGCSGFYNGVRVYKKKKNYRYIALKKDGYIKGIMGTGRLSLTFSKQNIQEQRQKVLAFIAENKWIFEEENEYENRDFIYLFETYSNKKGF